MSKILCLVHVCSLRWCHFSLTSTMQWAIIGVIHYAAMLQITQTQTATRCNQKRSRWLIHEYGHFPYQYDVMAVGQKRQWLKYNAVTTARPSKTTVFHSNKMSKPVRQKLGTETDQSLGNGWGWLRNAFLVDLATDNQSPRVSLWNMRVLFLGMVGDRLWGIPGLWTRWTATPSWSASPGMMLAPTTSPRLPSDTGASTRVARWCGNTKEFDVFNMGGYIKINDFLTKIAYYIPY